MSVAKNNKRMIKNTFVLYVRMVFAMGIGFFTTRELLSALGVVDFGLVNVIGSVVLMFSFLSGTMQATVSRYLSTDISLRDNIRLRQTFNLTMLMYFFLIALVVILSLTIGEWFFGNKLSIAAERKIAGLCFFQFSVAAFAIGILTVPYSSLVISHEEIKVYAWVGSADSIARLLIVYALYLNDYDRLAAYGGLLFLVAVINFFVYFGYCYAKYPECKPLFFWDSQRCKEMLAFSLWNLWGALSGLFSNVFLNILLNSYFGPTVNAARAIAMQGAIGVSNFVTNFLTAVRPQIFKYYAEGSRHLAVELSIKSARAGFFLLLLFALPVCLEMKYVLSLWLAEVPSDADHFMRLILIQRLVEILAYPLVTLSQACGRIALYQTVVGVLQWAVFPISWASLERGWGAESVFWSGIILSAFALVAQFYLINLVVSEFSIFKFIKNAVLPSITVSGASLLVPAAIHFSMQEGMLRFILVCFFGFIFTGLAIYWLGIIRDERSEIRSFVVMKFRRAIQ